MFDRFVEALDRLGEFLEKVLEYLVILDTAKLMKIFIFTLRMRGCSHFGIVFA